MILTRAIDRHPHRGLTLLEVLIATTILSVMAWAVVPSVARALEVLRQPGPSTSVDRVHLNQVVNAFLLDPGHFGVDLAPDRLHQITDKRIAWSTEDPRFGAYAGRPIDVRSVRAAGAQRESDHLWLQFTCDGVHVIRWVPIPPAVTTEARERS